jgi:cell division protein FtsI/penicillin-binding protein 2
MLEAGETLIETEGETAAGLDVASDAYRIISESTAAQVKDILREVVREGTGENAALENFTVAGKTGSAQVAGKGGYIKGKYVSTFIGFFPAENPRYLMLVTMAEPRGAYYASEVAAPAFREAAERIAMAKEVPPERKHEAQ